MSRPPKGVTRQTILRRNDCSMTGVTRDADPYEWVPWTTQHWFSDDSVPFAKRPSIIRQRLKELGITDAAIDTALGGACHV